MTSAIASLHPANLLTYVSLASGIGSVAAALRGSAAGAGACLALAALADTFDGRFARLFNRSPEDEALGAELDSLVDAVSFGAAPVAVLGILLSSVAPRAEMASWWAAAAVYVACALTRLARYNVTQNSDAQGFVGVPTPVAALVWSSVLVLGTSPIGASVVAVALGLAMVAPLPLSRPGPLGLTLFALWPMALMVLHLARA